mgnify:CR=1 FL=1
MTDDDLDPVVTVTDAMEAGFCPPGIVKWIKSQGKDYRAFRDGKYRVSDFASSMDGYATQVLRHIKNKRGQQ